MKCSHFFCLCCSGSLYAGLRARALTFVLWPLLKTTGYYLTAHLVIIWYDVIYCSLCRHNWKIELKLSTWHDGCCNIKLEQFPTYTMNVQHFCYEVTRWDESLMLLHLWLLRFDQEIMKLLWKIVPACSGEHLARVWSRLLNGLQSSSTRCLRYFEAIVKLCTSRLFSCQIIGLACWDFTPGK